MAFRAVPLNRFSDLPGNGFESLLPGDAFPFSFASFSNPLERILNAVRMIDSLELCIGLPQSVPRLLGESGSPSILTILPFST